MLTQIKWLTSEKNLPLVFQLGGTSYLLQDLSEKLGNLLFGRV
jgi:hypothetical protein